MDWLPPPEDFQAELKEALALPAPEQALAVLSRLAKCRLGLLETTQLDVALHRVGIPNQELPAAAKVAILSSATAEHLPAAIRVGGLRHDCGLDVYVGPLGQYRQEILGPSPALAAFEPDLVLFSLSAGSVVESLPAFASPADAEQRVSEVAAELTGLWDAARANLSATVIQQSFLDVADTLFGNHERLIPASPSRMVHLLNDRLADAAGNEGVLWLDVARASARDGIEAWFDVTQWLHGKIEIAPRAAPAYGELVGRLIAAYKGLSKKCLVLDLDGTLWGGVIGDDGIGGIVLGEGSAEGEAHLALQRYAKQLRERGVILAVCSKNEETIAEAAFEQHPEMLLSRSDFAAFVANWNDKAANLQAIAEQLNIGLDSLVFVDDNPVERARVRESLPMVAVPEMPDDPAHFVRRLADAGYFETISLTPEDHQRAAQYAANTEREALRSTTQSIDDFLRNLEMSVEFGPITELDLPRATQLIGKTNQFNTTTQRYSAEQMAGFAGDPDGIALQFRLKDRFGDNGLVSVMIMQPDPSESGVLELLNWVMSCRVFGRQLEHEALNIAVEAARSRGARTLRARFVPTPRNGVITDLFEKLSFRYLGEPNGDGKTSLWSLDLADFAPHQTFIERTPRER